MPIYQRDVLTHLNELALKRFRQFEPMYERIKRGLQNRKTRKYNTYEYLLSVFSLDPIVHMLSFNDIVKRFKRLPVGTPTIPPEPIVKSALTRLEKLQSSMGASLLEWHSRDQTLYILEPSFLFYLRWRKPRSATPTIVDLFKDFAAIVKETRGVTRFQLEEIEEEDEDAN